MDLCCEVNASTQCAMCAKKVCDLHTYGPAVFPEHMKTCSVCFLASTPEKELFRILYEGARKIQPKGYLSISLSVNDHFPRESPRSYAWNIYHEQAGHAYGKTVEEVLVNFKKRCEGEEDVL